MIERAFRGFYEEVQAASVSRYTR